MAFILSRNTVGRLTFSIFVPLLIFYGVVDVPRNIEQEDYVFWVLLSQKIFNAKAEIYRRLALGDKVSLAREAIAEAKPLEHLDLQVENEKFDGVHVRMYRPLKRLTNSPALVFLHASGWVEGHIDSGDNLAAEFARKLDIIVIAINHRLAPEHPYPAPLDDCEKAVRHLMKHAQEYNINPQRVAVIGESAGGNLALALSLRMRDSNAPHQLAHQLLLAPCLQAIDFMLPSYQQNAANALLSRDDTIRYLLLYALGRSAHLDALANHLQHPINHVPGSRVPRSLAEHVRHEHIPEKYKDYSVYRTPPALPHSGHDNTASLDAALRDQLTVWERRRVDPYFAPMMAAGMRRLPRVYVATMQHDVLRDDGLLLVRRLQRDSEAVTHRHYADALHAMTAHYQQLNVSRRIVSDAVDYLAHNL